MMRFILDCLRTPRARGAHHAEEGDTGVVETDEPVVAKATEIRELENAVSVEHLELQEQQTDRKELEETLEKLDTHRKKLQEEIKSTRQLCSEESQQILSLQAEEVKKEGQVEEYERELARARWRLKKLREEVKRQRRRVEEAGERDIPLQDSIKQSYDEIQEEEVTLGSLSGSARTPESQLDESVSPTDTTEEEPLPVRPWGRSQSLPAYADYIMRTSGSSFSNNLTETREEEGDSRSSTPKIDRCGEEGQGQIRDDAEKKVKEGLSTNPNPIDQLDFYQADPFVHCQTEHELFDEDLFPKTDSSGVFGSDPFKGTDPFAADTLFGDAAGEGEEADLSCAENKASTATQCFESEFPDEDSDIEISYSREDLDAIATGGQATDEAMGFKPIQSSSEELGPVRGWRSQGQYSTESDPNGYELDLGAFSPPSDIEELSMGSLHGGDATETAVSKQQGLGIDPAHNVSELQIHACSAGSQATTLESDWIDLGATEHAFPCDEVELEAWDRLEPQKSLELESSVTPQTSVDTQSPLGRSSSKPNREPSYELSYEPSSQSSFDPYGFKLSPEHSSHDLLDPDDSASSPEVNEPDLTFDPEPSSAQPNQLNFDPYGFELRTSEAVGQAAFDPYGFKLTPEGENQEVVDNCSTDNQEELEPSYDNQELMASSHYDNMEVLETCTDDNQEVLEPDIELLEFHNNGNQEVVEPWSNVTYEVLNVFSSENQEVLDFCNQGNQEVLEPCEYGNQELLESQDNQELLEPCSYDNQQVLEPRNQDNQELLDFCSNENQEVLDAGGHDNQEVLDLFSKDTEANNNHCVAEEDLNVNTTNNSSSNSSASIASSEFSNSPATLDLLGLELSNTTISNTDATNNPADPLDTAAGVDLAACNTTANQNPASFSVATTNSLLEGDLGSIFGTGGYVGCPDVADDLEPMANKQVKPVAEPVRPVRPVRPPRPSLMAKEQAQSKTQGLDLK